MERFHAARLVARTANLSEQQGRVTLGGSVSGEKKWWLDPGSNRGHTDFQSVALPTELSSHIRRRSNGRATMPKIPAPSSPFQRTVPGAWTPRSCLVSAFSATIAPMPTYIYQTIPKKKGKKPQTEKGKKDMKPVPEKPMTKKGKKDVKPVPEKPMIKKDKKMTKAAKKMP